MTATLMDGRALAARLLHHTAQRAAQFHTLQGRRPCLATVLVGNDPASHTYVRMKLNRCREVGIESRRISLDAATTTGQLVRVLRELSADEGVNGILLQHPVPVHVDERTAFEAIDPAKDVDGVTKASFASMAFGEANFCSCTPGGIMRLLEAYKVVLRGRRAVVVGRSSHPRQANGDAAARRVTRQSLTATHKPTTWRPTSARRTSSWLPPGGLS